ncbi:YciI family protein [Paraflavisolibacter sp. H34]|uniref:YciI family protein n=1 Tax=Huijunlia imazamoxiresistens TaxID=3127457 RepID=UPI0030168956
MDKKYFVLHLLPSRPDFAQTMTDEERTIMMSHVGYWTELMNQGKVVAFGPVLDPKAVYGLGIISADSEQEVQEFIANDPASKINRYEYFPMMAVVR